MSEERPVHSQEPAEGGEDEVEAPGAEKADDTDRDEAAEGRSTEHPQEPAEGGEEEAGAPGAEKADEAD